MIHLSVAAILQEFQKACGQAPVLILTEKFSI